MEALARGDASDWARELVLSLDGELSAWERLEHRVRVINPDGQYAEWVSAPLLHGVELKRLPEAVQLVVKTRFVPPGSTWSVQGAALDAAAATYLPDGTWQIALASLPPPALHGTFDSDHAARAQGQRRRDTIGRFPSARATTLRTVAPGAPATAPSRPISQELAALVAERLAALARAMQ